MIRFIVATLALLATLSTASAFDIKNMTDEERAAFRDAVRSYLLDNPEVIFEAAAIYEERQAAEQASNGQQLIALNIFCSSSSSRMVVDMVHQYSVCTLQFK